jgi:phage FluMu protein Com
MVPKCPKCETETEWFALGNKRRCPRCKTVSILTIGNQKDDFVPWTVSAKSESE